MKDESVYDDGVDEGVHDDGVDEDVEAPADPGGDHVNDGSIHQELEYSIQIEVILYSPWIKLKCCTLNWIMLKSSFYHMCLG